MRARLLLLPVGVLLVGGILAVGVPEARDPGGPSVDTSAYAQAEGTSQEITVLSVSPEVESIEERIQEHTDAQATSVKVHQDLTPEGFVPRSQDVTLDRILSSQDVQTLRAELPDPALTATVRTAVEAAVVLPVPDGADAQTQQRISGSIGLEGSNLIYLFNVRRSGGKLEVELYDLLPTGVTLEDVVAGLALEWDLDPDDIQVKELT